MAKINLTDISSGYISTSTFNANNTLLETAIEKTLSRDGTSPNSMEANLDMDSFRITNLPTAVNNTEPVILSQANTLAGVTNALTQNTVSAVLWPRTADETSAGVTPTKFYYEPGDIRRYGVSTSATAAVNVTGFKNAIASNDGMFIPSGTYLIDEQLSIAKDFYITYGNVIIDASAATVSGNFTENAVMYCDGGDLTAVSDLSVSPSKGANALTFSTSPDFSVGDVFLIFNPTNSSFSGFRTNYKEGEFCKVFTASGTAITIYDGLYSGYTAANVDVYSLTGRKFLFSGGNLHIKAPDTLNSVRGLKIIRGVGCRLNNVSAENSGDAGLNFKQCYDLIADGLAAEQNESFADNEYGLLIGNCQKLLINGNFWARRHACTLGGGSTVGDVPNREVHVSGTFTNNADLGTVSAADHHGNTEFCSYSGVFNGGINPGGDNNTYKGIVRKHTGGGGRAIYFSEMLGMNFDLSGLIIETTGDPTESTRGVIDIGGNDTTTMTVNTVRGGLLNLRGIVFRCPDAELLIFIRNRGSASVTEPIIIDVSNVKVLKSDTGSSNWLEINALSGDDFDALYIENVYDNGGGWSIANVTKVYGGVELIGSETWDPGSIADHQEEANEVTVTGAILGDFAIASLATDILDLQLSADVTAANTVTVVLSNSTTGAIDVASSTLTVKVYRRLGI